MIGPLINNSLNPFGHVVNSVKGVFCKKKNCIPESGRGRDAWCKENQRVLIPLEVSLVGTTGMYPFSVEQAETEYSSEMQMADRALIREMGQGREILFPIRKNTIFLLFTSLNFFD